MKRLVMLLTLAGMAVAVPDTAMAQKKAKKSRDVITSDEITESGQTEKNLAAVIRTLRPHFFEGTRGVRSAMGGGLVYPMVLYVDGRKQGGIEDLENIRASDVKEVRYLDPSQSINEYGTKANGGAIVVQTTAARRP